MADKSKERSDKDRDDDHDDDDVFTRDEDEAGRRALRKERAAARAAKREADELRQRLDQLEDKDKSDVERLQGEVERLKGERDAANSRADRLDIAMQKGLTPAQARRLVGSTREELEADADEILEAFPARRRDADDTDDSNSSAADKGKSDRDGSAPPSKRPTETLTGGREPNDTPSSDEMDPAKLAEFVPRP